MDALFVPLVNATGASIDQIKLICCLLIAYPLGNLFVRTPPHLKHIFNVTVTLVYFLPVLQMYGGFLQLLGDVLATYFLAKYWKNKNMPWLVFFLTMTHLLMNHVIRAWSNLSYETVEITGSQMVLVMKLSTFAWNAWDGARPAQDLDKWQMEKRVTKYPSLIEFLGYSFYFPGVLVGPYLDYAQYTDLVHETTLKDAAAKTKSARKIPPGRKRAAYFKAITGLSFLGLFVVFGGKLNFSTALTPVFLEYPFWYRIAIFQFYGFFERSKYYAIWSLTEGASIVTGLGFAGLSPSGEPLWNGAANIDIPNIEFAPNFKILLDSWNIKTNIWLRECIYKRVTPKGKKPGFRSSMLTFATSAIWHGIAPGYYLCFLTGGFVTTVARLIRANVRPLLLPPPNQSPSLVKRVYDIAGIVATFLLMNYCASAFMVLSFRNTFTVWARVGFYGHILVWGGMTFFYTGGLKFFKIVAAKRLAKDQLKAAAEAQEKEMAKNHGLYQVPPPIDDMVPPPK